MISYAKIQYFHFCIVWFVFSFICYFDAFFGCICLWIIFVDLKLPVRKLTLSFFISFFFSLFCFVVFFLSFCLSHWQTGGFPNLPYQHSQARVSVCFCCSSVSLLLISPITINTNWHNFIARINSCLSGKKKPHAISTVCNTSVCLIVSRFCRLWMVEGSQTHSPACFTVKGSSFCATCSIKAQ